MSKTLNAIELSHLILWY